MWHYTVEVLPDQQVLKIILFENGNVLSFGDVIERWKLAVEFRSFFNNLLAAAPFAAFFWETPPLRKSTLHRNFECILAESTSLTKAKADCKPFQSYFEAGKEVVGFPGLRGDVRLVVPCPIGPLEAYPHLAAFVRKAPVTQRDTFWKMVGETYETCIHENPTWLSTAGLGVSWLHVRIDSQPKYYRYALYKRISAL